MDSTLQILINVSAITAAVTAIIGLPIAIVKLWPLIKRGVTITASLETLPEMALELRGLATEQRSQGETLTDQNCVLANITDEVEKVKQQVKNDHDSNLREDLDRMHDDVRGAVGEVRAIRLQLNAHLNQPKTTINVNGGAP